MTNNPYTQATAPRDWPAFWRSLPPREAREAAKAMPKIAGPWVDETDESLPHRKGASVRTCAVEAMYSDRASADAALRAAGWILIDPEPEGGGRG